jgi:very-short-patch-repair endonuclease
MSDKSIARRVQAEHYIGMHGGVFLVRSNLADRLTRPMAAALQFRGNGIISGLSAARIWEIWGEADPPKVEVTVVGTGAGRPAGVRVRRVAALPAHDIRRRRGVPVASPARTLLDLAATLTSLELEAALANARRTALVRDSEIRRTLDMAPPQTAGIVQLRELLESATPARDTRSLYERKLLHLIELAQLPRPVTNVTVAGHMVDMLWPDAGLVVEFDSWRYHGGRHAFERDRLRDQDLAVHGLRVARVTATQVDNQPYATIASLAGALAAARATAGRTDGGAELSPA